MRFLKYLVYVLEHKWNVFRVAVKRKMFLHALTHDLSKLSGSEFIPYANYFYKDDPTKEDKLRFRMAWRHHYLNNPHHWQYWTTRTVENIPVDMPEKHVKEMLVDWDAMGLKFNDSAAEYYLDNKDKIIVTENTRKLIEKYLEM